MSFICLAEASHHCTVALPGGDQAVLQRFLQRPKRSMAALLTRQRMESQGDGRFLYSSRPFQILRFEITPEVLFSAQWSDPAQALEIAFEDCRIHGLGAMQSAIRFECVALLAPQGECVEAQARAAILLSSDSPLIALPSGLRQRLAQQALQLVFARLERRCQEGLRRALLDWIVKDASARSNVKHES
ncbi:conserved hypothetical protein (DUF1997) [Synechococcus sp. A15-28]|jgi:hypothetical protein|nr:conserved hypothetical protein (DUF1997) [Synechococcus sp. A15-28]